MTLRRVLIAAGVFYAVFIARSASLVGGAVYSTLFDDGMIAMRYARNLAAGSGLVWNPAGPRVQGYTSPLWTLVMSAVHAAGLPPRLAPMAVSAAGACILFVATTGAYRLARTITASEPVAVAAAAFTAFGYALVFWTLRGMETGLLAMLLVLALDAAVAYARSHRGRDFAVAAIAATLAMWTRLDAVVPFAVVLAYLVWNAADRRAAAAMAAAVVAAGVGLPLVLARWYYGAALPNAYYLKLEGIPPVERWARGVRTLAVFLIRGQGIALVPVIALVAGARRFSDRATRELLLIGGVVLSTFAYSVYVGGDVWEWMGYANRFVAIALPAVAVLMAAAADRFVASPRSIRIGAPVMSALLAAEAFIVIRLLATHRIDHAAFTVYDAHPAPVAIVVVTAACLLAIAAAIAARRSFAALCLVLWWFANGVPFVQWAGENAFNLRDDRRGLQLGLLLDRTLSPEASLAVAWAGNAPYFAGRPAIDLLGKNDAVIAHAAPAGAFVPGHNKRDLRHSIGDLRPDVACDLPTGLPGPPDEGAYLAEQGYRFIGGTCYLGPFARVDEPRLRAGLAALDW